MDNPDEKMEMVTQTTQTVAPAAEDTTAKALNDRRDRATLAQLRTQMTEASLQGRLSAFLDLRRMNNAVVQQLSQDGFHFHQVQRRYAFVVCWNARCAMKPSNLKIAHVEWNNAHPPCCVLV